MIGIKSPFVFSLKCPAVNEKSITRISEVIANIGVIIKKKPMCVKVINIVAKIFPLLTINLFLVRPSFMYV